MEQAVVRMENNRTTDMTEHMQGDKSLDMLSLPWVLQQLQHLDMGNLRKVIAGAPAGAPAGPPPPWLEPAERKVWGLVLFELRLQA